MQQPYKCCSRLSLGEPEAAWQHLQQAEAGYAHDVWFRWIYYPRLQAETPSYWMAQGELSMALARAHLSLEQAETTLNRKRMAWAHKLLGDIATVSDRPEDARIEFDKALQVLVGHPCPTIEWQILKSAALAAGKLRDSVARDELLRRARGTVQMLSESVFDVALRRKFLRSKPIRDLLS
jgi:hypothetical protein